MTLTAFLTALAIVIPLVMPIKIVVHIASFTLASHVAIFGYVISPIMTVIVVIDSAYWIWNVWASFYHHLRLCPLALRHQLLFICKSTRTLDGQKKTWTTSY